MLLGPGGGVLGLECCSEQDRFLCDHPDMSLLAPCSATLAVSCIRCLSQGTQDIPAAVTAYSGQGTQGLCRPVMVCLLPEGDDEGGFPCLIAKFDSVLCLTRKNTGLIGEESGFFPQGP